MAPRQVAALVALLCAATPGLALEPANTGSSTMFYMSIPLDARSVKEQMPAFGLSIQGRHQQQLVNVDTRTFNFLGLGGLEAKWLIAGGAAVFAAVAVGRKDKGRQAEFEAAQQQQAQAQAQPNSPHCPPVSRCHQ
ncbi:MAG TPA: hypothetical protein VET51_08655 [Burkholderiales bacterium]|nr:hypothetical protein [Burkholderiales bacterium]